MDNYLLRPGDCGRYAQELWNAQRATISPLRDNCVVGADFWVDDKPPEGNLIQVFEPQIGYDLSLSFVKCAPIAQADYVFTPRSPEIRDELRVREKQEDV